MNHKMILKFHSKGRFWCWSGGPYDDICERCGFRWEETKEGFEALMESEKTDPRHLKNRTK